MIRKKVPARNLWLILVLLSALVVIGSVISVKIGGGSNLHNLDMFLVAMALVAAFLCKMIDPLKQVPPMHQAILVAVIVMPMLWVFSKAIPYRQPRDSERYLQPFLEKIEGLSEEGEILFIDQRHFFTFGYLESIPLVPEYELVELMDHAMAGNVSYLAEFYSDLEEQRFVAIISDPLPIVWKGRTASFGEENDAWVRYVSEPILAEYEPTIQFDEVGVWILQPKSH
jgi:hypothetical protein